MGEDAPLRVSVLEDCLFIRDAVCQVLEQRGIEVAGAHADADAFFARLGEERPNVALIDIFLMPGPQAVLDRLQREQPGLTAVVFASRSEPDLIDRAREAGVKGYLEKRETSVDDLVSALRAAREGKLELPTGAIERARVPTPDDAAALLDKLSAREREVLGFISAGYDNLKIAATLDITERTVRAHVSNLYRKLESENRASMALLGYRMGLVRR